MRLKLLKGIASSYYRQKLEDSESDPKPSFPIDWVGNRFDSCCRVYMTRSLQKAGDLVRGNMHYSKYTGIAYLEIIFTETFATPSTFRS